MSFSEGLEVVQFRDSWWITMWWPEGAVSGGPQKIVIEAAPDAPPGDVARGISTTVLRRMDLAEAVRKAQETAPTSPPWQAQEGRLVELAALAGRLLGEEGVSQRYLSVLCLTYRDLVDKGVQAPVPWLAEQVGRKPDSIKDHLKKARRDGLLTSRAGRAGGDLTEVARAALEGVEGGRFSRN
ncbi:hypothetical protein OG897_17865 [Streptomyces sp. NBC_00237]|uniref:hypothetical protein n=1 Tax=Streptomyces sp. NBC_00237 TaxID=2975687 RepID=UPI002251C354|nr:hypothetical protein [Streptomyces sp. NBC_00237]MCX5203305.1 hypothetical protein [Streptomyces sp. NBC_00237]